MKRKKLLLTLLGVLLALPALARDFTYPYEGQSSMKKPRPVRRKMGWSILVVFVLEITFQEH